jgi:hypothetical protein
VPARFTLRKAGKLFRLGPAELRDLLEAQWALLSSRRSVRSRPIGTLIENQGAEEVELLEPEQLKRARELALAVERVVENGLGRPTCLVKAIAIQRMLARRGIGPGIVRVGASLAGGSLKAHAWVEVGGEILGDTEEHVRSFEPVSDMRLIEF